MQEAGTLVMQCDWEIAWREHFQGQGFCSAYSFEVGEGPLSAQLVGLVCNASLRDVNWTLQLCKLLYGLQTDQSAFALHTRYSYHACAESGRQKDCTQG